MLFEFDDVPAWWYALCETLSARIESSVQPPESDWTVAPATVAAGVVSCTITGTVSGSHTFECPEPPATRVGLEAIEFDARWRRFLIPNGVQPGEVWIDNTQKALIEAIYPAPSVFGSGEFELNWGLTHPRVKIDIHWYYFDPLTPNFPWGEKSAVPVFYMYFVPNGVYSTNPDSKEDFASFMQFGGDEPRPIASDDINAINTLADALADSGMASGTLQTHRGKSIISAASYNGPLPLVTGTSDNAMKRLAAGVNIAFGGDLTIQTSRPKALVAPRRGVIFRRA